MVDPADYSVVLQEMKKSGGEISRDTKLKFANKVFTHTARYDTLIANYLTAVIKKERS